MKDENLIFAVAGDNRHRPEAKDREILIIDVEGKLISAELPNKYTMNYRSSSYSSFLYNDKIIYSRPFHKYVYSVDQTGAAGKYSVTMRDSPLPEDYEKKSRGDFEHFMDNGLSTCGEDIVGSLDARYLSAVPNRDKFPSLDNIKEEDNPLIFRFRFRHPNP
jgi:hypothetical protein